MCEGINCTRALPLDCPSCLCVALLNPSAHSLVHLAVLSVQDGAQKVEMEFVHVEHLEIVFQTAVSKRSHISVSHCLHTFVE